MSSPRDLASESGRWRSCAPHANVGAAEISATVKQATLTVTSKLSEAAQHMWLIGSACFTRSCDARHGIRGWFLVGNDWSPFQTTASGSGLWLLRIFFYCVVGIDISCSRSGFFFQYAKKLVHVSVATRVSSVTREMSSRNAKRYSGGLNVLCCL